VHFQRFRATNSLRANRLSLVQKFYDQTVSSHGDKYVHHVKVLLEDVVHVKLVRSVIIVRESDLEVVLSFLKKYEGYTRDIVLTPEDEKTQNKEDE
jgi:hypothetical protein